VADLVAIVAAADLETFLGVFLAVFGHVRSKFVMAVHRKKITLISSLIMSDHV
jgi:hypothetical protein